MARHVDRDLAIFRDIGHQADPCQLVERNLTIQGVILNQQDAGAGAGVFDFCFGINGEQVRFRHIFSQMQACRHPEGAALAWRAFKTGFATHQLRQLAADGEAKTGAAVAPAGGFVGLGKRLEQVHLRRWRDADAGIFNLEAQ